MARANRADHKYNPHDLKHYLDKYPVKFDQDLDDIWHRYDRDKNNWLDRQEASNFMLALNSCVQQDKKQYYSPEKFEKLFTQFDFNKDGWLSKPEMAVLIKKTFAPNQ